VFALLSGIFLAISQIIMKITGESVKPISWALYASSFGAVFAPVEMILVQQRSFALSENIFSNYLTVISILCVALFLLLGQTLIVTALYLEKATTVGIITNVEILTTMAADILFFNVSFAPKMIAGVVILLANNVVLVASKAFEK